MDVKAPNTHTHASITDANASCFCRATCFSSSLAMRPPAVSSQLEPSLQKAPISPSVAFAVKLFLLTARAHLSNKPSNSDT